MRACNRAFAPFVPLLALFLGWPDVSAAAPLDVRMLDVPTGPGAQAPSLSSAHGVVVLSWLEPAGEGQRLRFSVFDRDRFSEARDVAAGDRWFVNWADLPSVMPLGDSLWAAHWLVMQPDNFYAYDIHLALSKDGGKTWSEPVTPHDDGAAAEHGFVSLFPEGDGVGLVWLDGRNYANEADDETMLMGTMLRAASFGPGLGKRDDRELDDLVCDCCQTDAAMSEAGPVVAYRNRTPDETRDIYVARRLEDGWSPGVAVGRDGWTIGGCPVNGPAIAADGRRVAVAWFTGAGDQPRVRLAVSNDAAARFSAPVDVVSGATYGHAGVALLSGGRTAVSSLCKVAEQEGRVCLRILAANGQAGPVHIVSGERPVPPLSVPQLGSDGDVLVVAWLEELDGVTTVRAARINPGLQTGD